LIFGSNKLPKLARHSGSLSGVKAATSQGFLEDQVTAATTTPRRHNSAGHHSAGHRDADRHNADRHNADCHDAGELLREAPTSSRGRSRRRGRAPSRRRDIRRPAADR